MNPEKLRETRYKIIIDLLKDDPVLRENVKDALKWWKK